MYEAHARRKAIERCVRLKEAIISGVWSNSNYDSEKRGQESPRVGILNEIEEKFVSVIAEIRGEEVPEEYRVEIDRGDPFFSAMTVPDIDPGEDAPEKEEKSGDDYVPEFDQE